MKNIRYALASVSYHKKISFSIGISSIFFLFSLTSILNLMDLEKSLYKQVNSLLSISDYFVNYKKIMELYSSLSLLIFIVWLVVITTLILISLKSKKQDMLKWRIKGFSTHFIIRQTVLETFIPVLAGMIISSLFFIVCQHTYEFILVHVRPLISTGLNIKPISFFSSDMVIESTPNQLVSTSSDVQFFSIGIDRLTDSYIMQAFYKSCLAIIFTTIGITLFLTYAFSRKSKNIFRM